MEPRKKVQVDKESNVPKTWESGKGIPCSQRQPVKLIFDSTMVCTLSYDQPGKLLKHRLRKQKQLRKTLIHNSLATSSQNPMLAVKQSS